MTFQGIAINTERPMQTKFFFGLSPAGFHKVAYIEWGADSDAVPVICVHALTFNGRTFDRLAEDLQSDRRVFCPDIVGRGQSDWLNDPAFYTNPHYIPDMTAMIARTGTEQVDWVGTSMGGLLGIMMASLPNSPIRRLVLNDVGPFVSLEALKGIGSYLETLPPGFAAVQEVENYLRKTYAAFGNLSDADWAHITKHDIRRLPNGRVARGFDPAIRQSLLSGTEPIDLWASYDKITCPTLLLHGETSRILSADVADEMTRRGPKAKLITLPGIGHHPALMNEEQINIVTSFLRAP